MKGRCTRLLATLVLLTGANSSVLAFDFFGLFADEDNSIDSMLQSVPADTVAFVGGHSNSDAAPFFDDYMGSTSETDLRELNAMLQGKVDAPGLKLFGWLLEDYMTVLNEGYQATMDRYGLAEDGAGAFYMHGATPVARFAVSDEAALWTLLDQAAAATDTQPVQTELEGAQVRSWAVTPADADISLELAFTSRDGIATVALLNQADTADNKARRLGLTAIDDSLAETGTWEALQESYGFDQQIRGYLDIAGLTESLLIPANTSLGRDLQQLSMDEMGDSLDAVCRNEIVALTRQTPRLVVGGDDYDIQSNSMTQSARMILELTNAQVTTELQKLTGSLPAYSGDASDKLLAFALGIDVDSLAPVATALWTQFTSASFECDTLTQWQAQAQSTNPAMIGMFTGMAQGVKGVGAALYSLTADSTSPVGLGGSLLLSLSADNPQTVAALISSSVPGMASLNIPANGEPVQVPVPAPNLEVYAAIKGKHLVVYTGDEAKAAADAMTSESLNKDGTTSLAANYQRFGDAMLTVLDVPEMASQMTMAEGADGCTELYATFLQLSQTPLQLNYRDNYTDRGWEGEVEVAIQSGEGDINVQPGQYRTETLNYDCSWYSTGTETLNSNGTGQYVETDDSGQCELYINEYRWEQKGGKIVQNGTTESSRDSCEADWTEREAESFDCSIVATHDTGFYCRYDFDNGPVLKRYTR